MALRLDLASTERWARGWWTKKRAPLPPPLRNFRAWVDDQPRAARVSLVKQAREFLWTSYFDDSSGRVNRLQVQWAGWSVLRAMFEALLIAKGKTPADARRRARAGVEALGGNLRAFPERAPGGRKRKVSPEAIALRNELAKRLRKAEPISYWAIASRRAAEKFKLNPDTLRRA